ncbi:hypothetical protein SNE40_011655 [Patella caerulea]
MSKREERLFGGHSAVKQAEQDLRRQKGFLAVFNKLFRRNRKKKLRKEMCSSVDTGLSSNKDCVNIEIRQRSLSVNDIDVMNITKPKGTWLYVSDVILTNADRTEILDGKCLNDDIIHAAQLLLKKQFPGIHGLQDPNHAPVKTGMNLTSPLKFNPVEEPCAQIHHNGRNHWVTSIKDSPDSDILLLDSAYYKDTITASLQIQFQQIYRTNMPKLSVTIPRVPKQLNKYDCGVYAIAFLTEYCFRNYLGEYKISFKTEQMRPHLVKCLSRGKMSPFPR